MTFRSKSADQVLEEIKYLTSRHKRLSLCAVDNIIDFRYFDNLLPRLRALRMSGVDLSLFYETKANLKRDQLLLMREAGILAIQPGIESLSTPILRLMRKGVTALQNIRLLKWSAELGIRVIWNLLYGIPREPPEEYQRMASVIPSLTHLTPPAITPVVVDRFSPYHSQPREFGLNVTGPASWYPLCYQVEKKVLDDLAYEFSHIYEDSRNPVDYVRPVAKAVRSWKAANMAGSALVYESGLDFLRIHEGRPNFSPRIYTLEKGEALAYAACDSGATTAHLQRVLKDNGFEMPLNEVTAFLQDLVDAKLVAVENGTYLSLAVRVNRHIPSREGVVPPQD